MSRRGSGELFEVFRKRRKPDEEGGPPAAPPPLQPAPPAPPARNPVPIPDEPAAAPRPTPTRTRSRSGIEPYEVRLGSNQLALVALGLSGALIVSFLIGRKVGLAKAEDPAAEVLTAGTAGERPESPANPLGRPADGPYTLRIASYASAADAEALRRNLVEVRGFPGEAIRVRPSGAYHVVEVGSYESRDSERALHYKTKFAEVTYQGAQPFTSCLLVEVDR